MARPAGALGAFARLVSTLWFHHTERAGPPLPDGPVLLVLNHPNGLLDPLLTAALLERPPRFVAKATFWKAAPLRPFLAFFRAIPVQRAQDLEPGAGPEARAAALAATFTAAFTTFARGEVLGIFPEGISHAGHDLAPLKTGPARMLLGAPVRPALVPAGLVYGDRSVFRHSALLQVGEPVPTGDLHGLEPETVLALTERIRAALYPLTVHGPDGAVAGLAQEMAWLLAEGPRQAASLEAHRARVRALQDWLAGLTAAQRAGVAAEVRQAAAQLQARGIRPDQVGHPYAAAEVLRWAPRALGRILLALACLPAGLLHWPAYWLVGRLSRRGGEDLDVVATSKLLAGALLLPLWSLLMLGAVWFGFGHLGAWAWAAAVPAAILSLPLSEALAADARAVRGWFARRDPALPALLEAREQLLEAVPGLRESPATRPPVR